MAENAKQPIEECKHIGTLLPVGQTLVPKGRDILVICSSLCSMCGHFRTNINLIPDVIKAPEEKPPVSTIIK